MQFLTFPLPPRPDPDPARALAADGRQPGDGKELEQAGASWDDLEAHLVLITCGSSDGLAKLWRLGSASAAQVPAATGRVGCSRGGGEKGGGDEGHSYWRVFASVDFRECPCVGPLATLSPAVHLCEAFHTSPSPRMALIFSNASTQMQYITLWKFSTSSPLSLPPIFDHLLATRPAHARPTSELSYSTAPITTHLPGTFSYALFIYMPFFPFPFPEKNMNHFKFFI